VFLLSADVAAAAVHPAPVGEPAVNVVNDADQTTLVAVGISASSLLTYLAAAAFLHVTVSIQCDVKRFVNYQST